jgi:hypothetical protein
MLSGGRCESHCGSQMGRSLSSLLPCYTRKVGIFAEASKEPQSLVARPLLVMFFPGKPPSPSFLPTVFSALQTETGPKCRLVFLQIRPCFYSCLTPFHSLWTGGILSAKSQVLSIHEAHVIPAGSACLSSNSGLCLSLVVSQWGPSWSLEVPVTEHQIQPGLYSVTLD